MQKMATDLFNHTSHLPFHVFIVETETCKKFYIILLFIFVLFL